MPETISPVTREEDYLAAIAGQDVTPPTPVTRKEEWLDLIADKVDGLAGDIEDLQDVVPTPEAADSGKVLTAGADGAASWQTPSGGGDNVLIVHATGTGTYDGNGSWTIASDVSVAEMQSAINWDTGEISKLVYVQFPAGLTTDPYWNYTGGSAMVLMDNPEMATATVGSVSWMFGYDDGAYVFVGTAE